ncbi:DUF438 domain-containing protein [Enterococcus sp. LJL98]
MTGRSREVRQNRMIQIAMTLSEGGSFGEAMQAFLDEFETLNPAEVAAVEQVLTRKKVALTDFRRLCEIHEAIHNPSHIKIEQDQPGHPIHTFKLENQVIQSLLNDEIEGLFDQIARGDWSYNERLIMTLQDLNQIGIHYTRKEKLLFPFLETYEMFEPAQVMRRVDDRIRKLIYEMITYAEKREKDFYILFEQWSQLKEEIEEMIYKEESIIFPLALELFHLKDWEEIAKESYDWGFAYIPDPIFWQASTQSLLEEETFEPFHPIVLEKAKGNKEEILHGLDGEAPVQKDTSQWEEISQPNEIVFPTGMLTVDQLIGIFQALPVDLTFFDTENRVHFYSERTLPIFPRTKATIGREVTTVYPPKNMTIVDAILNDFKNGRKEPAEFWMDMKDRQIHIRYFPIRDQKGSYQGCLEVAQDVTKIEKQSNQRVFFESYVDRTQLTKDLFKNEQKKND